MKEFDHTGLLLAEYQGKLFEKSTELNCSSAVFFSKIFTFGLCEEDGSE